VQRLEVCRADIAQRLIVMIGCAINERLQKALDYKSEEVVILKQILREVTKKERIDLTEDQRTRLALLGKALTAKERREYCVIVKPRTILDWFRRICAEKYDSHRRDQMSVETWWTLERLLPRGGLDDGLDFLFLDTTGSASQSFELFLNGPLTSTLAVFSSRERGQMAQDKAREEFCAALLVVR